MGMLNLQTMSSLRAHVRNGRLVLDVPTDLPEGSVLDLVPADSWDALSLDDRNALHRALARSAQDAAAGRLIDGDALLDRLGKRE